MIRFILLCIREFLWLNYYNKLRMTNTVVHAHQNDENREDWQYQVLAQMCITRTLVVAAGSVN